LRGGGLKIIYPAYLHRTPNTEKTKTAFKGVGYPAYRPLAKPLPKPHNTTPSTLMNSFFIGIIPATSEKKQHKFPAFAFKGERVIRKS